MKISYFPHLIPLTCSALNDIHNGQRILLQYTCCVLIVHCNLMKIAQAKTSFQRIESIPTKNYILIQTRTGTLECYFLNPFWCMYARPGKIQNKYNANWRHQKFDYFGECYECHGLQRNQTELLREAHL